MRSGGNFHPEWGYLAPAPSFMRTARIVAVATAIGATAGAAVVLSLAGTSGSGVVAADGEKSVVVVHSFVQPAEAAPLVARQTAAPPDMTAPVTVPPPAPAAVNAVPNVQASVRPTNSTSQSLPSAAQISPPAASESHSASTPAVPASVAALAEVPPATDVSPGLSPGSAAQVTFAPDQTGAARDGGKKQRSTDQAAQRGTQVAAAPAKKRPEEQHGLGPLLRHLFSARAGSSYYPN
jgi:hypothetical protein